MEDHEKTLREVVRTMVEIRSTLDRLIKQVEQLPHKMEMAEIHPLETMATPQGFNKGPHFPGLG